MTTPDILHATQETRDPEDILLLCALVGMQATARRHLLEMGLSIDDLDNAAQQALVDKVKPYLGFELSQSDGIWVGMPFTASGNGGILAADHEGSVIAAQHMSGEDSVTGIVHDVLAYPVPSIECMLAAAEDTEHNVPSYTQSFSAVVVLHNAQFRTQQMTGGLPSNSVHDLSGMQVIVPVVYGMEMTVPDIFDL